MYLRALAKHYGFKISTPVYELPAHILDIILYGSKGEKIKITYEKDYGSGSFSAAFEGVLTSAERRYKETQSDGMKQYYEEFMSTSPYTECKGARLKKEALRSLWGTQYP